MNQRIFPGGKKIAQKAMTQFLGVYAFEHLKNSSKNQVFSSCTLFQGIVIVPFVTIKISVGN